MSTATIRRRIAGRLGLGGGPGSDGVGALFSPEPQVLEEGKRELAQERVMVQAAPAPALEVIEAQLVLHLLVHLLADPAGLDQGGQRLERGIGREIGQVVLPFAGGAVLADQWARLGLAPRAGITVQTHHIAMVMAEQGFGPAIIDSFTAQASANERLHVRTLLPEVPVEVHALQPLGVRSPRPVSDFIAALHEVTAAG